jgi:hypothetical protein
MSLWPACWSQAHHVDRCHGFRHSRIALTMEIYTQVPDEVTREPLKQLSDWLGYDQGDGGNQ